MGTTAYEVYDIASGRALRAPFGGMTEATMWGLGLPPIENWEVRPVISDGQKGDKANA